MAAIEQEESHAMPCHAMPCSALFPQEHYEEYRQQCAALTRDKLDLVLLGQMMALLSNDTETGARSKKAPTRRQQSAMLFHHGGWRTCGKTFQKMHGIGTIAIINTCNV